MFYTAYLEDFDDREQFLADCRAVRAQVKSQVKSQVDKSQYYQGLVSLALTPRAVDTIITLIEDSPGCTSIRMQAEHASYFPQGLAEFAFSKREISTLMTILDIALGGNE